MSESQNNYAERSHPTTKKKKKKRIYGMIPLTWKSIYSDWKQVSGYLETIYGGVGVGGRDFKEARENFCRWQVMFTISIVVMISLRWERYECTSNKLQ